MNQVPRVVKELIDAVGETAALDFLLEFGGTPVYLAENPGPRSLVVKTIGRELAVQLGRAMGPGTVHFPSVRPWIAVRLDQRGCNGIEIARRLKCDNRSVRRWLNQDAQPGSQLDLFVENRH